METEKEKTRGKERRPKGSAVELRRLRGLEIRGETEARRSRRRRRSCSRKRNLPRTRVYPQPHSPSFIAIMVSEVTSLWNIFRVDSAAPMPAFVFNNLGALLLVLPDNLKRQLM
ncbi:hypothetical protein MUK42_33022 [Musa troglodytarum]|uniref:Uncharacterized protein n=1 Tax=Musa troglodytarum TaxID=320322 RepID=A0A9E7IF50_9LILI|nr:hypothetical protein MUK42_33022 [Musa troglodytarum]